MGPGLIFYTLGLDNFGHSYTYSVLNDNEEQETQRTRKEHQRKFGTKLQGNVKGVRVEIF